MPINPDEVYDLDLEIAKFIIPRLKLYKNECLSLEETGIEIYPNDFKSFDEWILVIDKMISAFETYWRGVEYSDIMDEKYKEVKDGMYLFVKYYDCLWI